ncbi:MAG: indole-3-glycerol phosphate synthase TrpC [Acidimicrobiales bacterium]
MQPATYLDQIVAAHRAHAETDRRDKGALFAQAEATPAPRGFRDQVANHQSLAVVAEIKRRSPSKGDIASGLDVEAVAREYAAGGAACLSVLTDERFFGGSAQDLVVARGVCALPVLRKDFTVGEADVCDARIMGADAVLLIAGVLSDEELGELHALVRELAMDALVEVHDEEELDRALALGVELVAVNQRDLETFEVDTTRATRLARSIPSGVVAVAESGIASAEDARVLADAGYQAVLVGESLLRARDRRKSVSELGGHEVAPRKGAAVHGRARR